MLGFVCPATERTKELGRVTVRIDGDKVREIREDLLYSQRELARIASMAHETVHRIESGERVDVLGSTVRKLAKALDVDPHDLLEGAELGKVLARQ